MRILIVEDNPGDFLLFREHLSESGFSGYTLERTASMAETEAQLSRASFDIIFLDLSLPDTYGVETLFRLRNIAPNVPVIIITGISDEKIWMQAIQAGAQDYLVKGQFDGFTLLRALRYSVERHRLLFELASANVRLQNEIMEKSAMQKRNQEEKERLSIMLRSIADGVIAVGYDRRITLINTSASQMTGFPTDEAMGTDVGAIFRVTRCGREKESRNIVSESLATGEIIGLGADSLLVSKDGREVFISATCSPIRDGSNNITGAILVFSDETEAKKAEEEIMKVSKLESMSLLASGIAHDFNNFLTGIVGNITMAKMLTEPDDQVFKVLTDAEEVSFQAKELTAQLLTFARGGGTPVKSVVEMGELIKNSVNFMARGANVKCEFDIQTDLWKTEIDKGQINQVISNLVINAIQAMPGGGTITTSAGNVTLTAPVLSLKAGKHVKITISDTGTGISPENIDKIFDPYFTTKPKGNGLGLASAYSILKNHGGLIAVDSEPGKGTSFHLYLPATGKFEAADKKSSTPSENAGDGGKILIMDDEENIRTITSQLLSHLGYEVHQAADGNEAYELYVNARNNGNPFDIIILDLTVPGGPGGVEALAMIRKIDPEVRAIAASGYFSGQESISEYRIAGFSDFITKPFKIQTLTSAIKKITAAGAAESCDI